jgi:3'-5' exonuclease
MNLFVFDIETVPDIELGKKIYQLDGLNDDDVAKVLFTKQRQKTGSEFLPHYLHQIVAISIVFKTKQTTKVWSLGSLESTEAELIQRFYDGVDKYQPTLVSWNGGGFDLPVLHYRGLKHGVDASRYWDQGELDRDYKWNNYVNRYHSRHTDLMDVLAGFQPRANASLEHIALMLGFPGKLGMSGASVWPAYHDGRLQDIRNYCETDVLNTYLVYLRWELIRGNLDQAGFDNATEELRAVLAGMNRDHLNEFVKAWDNS